MKYKGQSVIVVNCLGRSSLGFLFAQSAFLENGGYRVTCGAIERFGLFSGNARGITGERSGKRVEVDCYSGSITLSGTGRGYSRLFVGNFLWKVHFDMTVAAVSWRSLPTTYPLIN